MGGITPSAFLPEIGNMSRSNTRQVNMQSLLAVCGIAGPVFYAILLVTLGAIEPDYSHLSQTMSELGAVDARYNIIMNTAMIAIASRLFIFASSVIFVRSINNVGNANNTSTVE